MMLKTLVLSLALLQVASSRALSDADDSVAQVDSSNLNARSLGKQQLDLGRQMDLQLLGKMKACPKGSLLGIQAKKIACVPTAARSTSVPSSSVTKSATKNSAPTSTVQKTTPAKTKTTPVKTKAASTKTKTRPAQTKTPEKKPLPPSKKPTNPPKKQTTAPPKKKGKGF
ncbi:hypothetical protein VHEMI04511 [[Torrubiella] hemipterigena]|uniref:Uncharacterized protein n=1 Tax=[Torrubiella] hemipterigena TaxID=1531966 RepID=A0A0A1TEJ7_9HYPO|nr:hypothetical protein VHEMI04511 [[Torrubiella] hemipterigena]